MDKRVLLLSFGLIFIIDEVELRVPKFDQSCITPNNEQAKCTPIYFCKVFLGAVKTVSHSQKKFMRESVCGQFRNIVIVCCGSHADYLRNKKRVKKNVIVENSLSNSECGLSRVDERPSGGRVTLSGEFPWLVRLHYNNSKSMACEGSLINKRYIITAGLCVADHTIKHLGKLDHVSLGEHNCRPHEKCKDHHVNIGVEKVILHKDFIAEGSITHNDIGIVKLLNDVTFNDYIRPICLPNPKEEAQEGDWLTETGWSRHSNEKLKADLPFVSPQECLKAYADNKITLKKVELCAGGESIDSCVAISGGGLIKRKNVTPARWYLEGIVSFGPRKCAFGGLPNVYTKVETYLDWINSEVTL